MMSDSSTTQNTGQSQPAADWAEGPSARTPIPRGERARARVLKAALAVLADCGMPGFSLEAVAHRAGASKATIYRHWTSRGELLVDAMSLVSQRFPVPATGHLRTDLIELISQAQAMLTSEPFPRLLAAFVDAAERDSTLSRLHVRLTERGREPLRHVLTDALRRGKIRSGTDIELTIDLLAGPLFYRRFIGHQAFPHDFATTVVDQVLAAIVNPASAPDESVP